MDFKKEARMAKMRSTTEQIITKLREAEVRYAQERRVVQAFKQMGDNRAHLLPLEAMDSLIALWHAGCWRAGRSRSLGSVRSGSGRSPAVEIRGIGNT